MNSFVKMIQLNRCAQLLAAICCHLLFYAAFASAGSSTVAQEHSRALYIIFDGSNSMWGELPDKSRKISAAKSVFRGLDPALFAGREVALRLYGHRVASDCADSELSVPFTPAESGFAQINAEIDAVSPRGKTPITRSLKAALEDFGDRVGDILLISDGIETCDSDPCDLVRSWRESDIDIRVHVIGLGLSDLSRNAMQCMANASGTQYFDARNADEFSAAIMAAVSSKPIQTGDPDPEFQPGRPEFTISAVDDDGNYVPVQGTLVAVKEPGEQEALTVVSNRRYVIPAGLYKLLAGVPTASGDLFRPVHRDIEVSASEPTNLRIVLQRPPMIRTRFLAAGVETHGAIATAYDNDSKAKNTELFKLRPREEYYVMPGSYLFKSTLNADNSTLVASALISEGDDRTIDFDVIRTVRAMFVVKPEGSDKLLRQHQQLYQAGELKYKIHYNNGGDVQPGIYTLRSDDELTPYEVNAVEISEDDGQIIELTVPMALVRLRYDLSKAPANPDLRCWLRRVDANGDLIARSRALVCDGREYYLTNGHYEVVAYDRLGDFLDTHFSVELGDSMDVSIRQRKPADLQ